MTGCGFARQLVQVRNEHCLGPYRRQALRLSFCWYFQDSRKSSNLAKTAYDSYRILLRSQRIRQFVEEHYL
jgi:hypothetical protein